MPQQKKSRWEQGEVCAIGDSPKIMNNDGEILPFSYRLVRWHGKPRAGIQVGDKVSFTLRKQRTRVSLLELRELDKVSARGSSRGAGQGDFNGQVDYYNQGCADDQGSRVVALETPEFEATFRYGLPSPSMVDGEEKQEREWVSSSQTLSSVPSNSNASFGTWRHDPYNFESNKTPVF